MASYGQIAGSFGRLNNLSLQDQYAQQTQKGDFDRSQEMAAIARDPNKSKYLTKREKEDLMSEEEYQRKYGKFYLPTNLHDSRTGGQIMV